VEARGQALVVSNGQPRPVAELLTLICRAVGAPRPRFSVPVLGARVAGALVEAAWAAAPGLRRRSDPPMTRFLAEQLSTAHWFDQRRTRRLLHWAPRVDLDSGIAALARGAPTTVGA
jgi:nucleoside-diphosphate-sugar epimerase